MVAALSQQNKKKLPHGGFSKLQRVAGQLALALNVVRIYLMALSDDMYLYWYRGMGAHIFPISASIGAVLISAFGARWVSLRSVDRLLAAPST